MSTSAVLRYHHVLDTAYDYSETYRNEFEILSAFVRAVFSNIQVQRILRLEHNRFKAFDLFLCSCVEPCVLSFLDAPSVLACVAVSRTWQQQALRFETYIWDNLCRSKFQISCKNFTAADVTDISPRLLYKHTHCRLRRLLSGKRDAPLFHGSSSFFT